MPLHVLVLPSRTLTPQISGWMAGPSPTLGLCTNRIIFSVIISGTSSLKAEFTNSFPLVRSSLFCLIFFS